MQWQQQQQQQQQQQLYAVLLTKYQTGFTAFQQ
jgi:hypothetical protein